MKTRLFAGLLTSSLLVACAAPAPQTDRGQPQTSTPSPRESQLEQPRGAGSFEPETDFNPAGYNVDAAEQWISEAERNPGESANELLLRAAEVLLQEGETDRADDVVGELIIPELEPGQALRLAMIRARVYRGHAQFQEAISLLSDTLVERAAAEAPLARQLQFSQLRASLFAIQGDHLSAAREWIFIDPLLSATQQPHNREQIWRSLMQVPTEQLRISPGDKANQDLLGWVELATIARNQQGTLDEQVQQRDAWLQRWPKHPAVDALPGGLNKLDQLIVERPDKVALLLPVTGQLAPYGKAIRDGFMAAYYAAKAEGAALPKVRPYDTASQEINTVYQQALAEGNRLIIGPLRKENVEALLADKPASMVVPTLALNTIPGEQFPTGLYQFGLNPEDEAEQLARIAATKGYKRAMMLIPEGAWGTKVAEAFSQRWQQLGGSIVASTNFDAEANNYSKQIKDILQIDASIKRRNQVQQIIGKLPEFEPYRRTDADFIFLVARPNEGRAIKPLLAYHYAGSIPVYATSHIFTGVSSPDKDQDINGVNFVDIPWVLGERSELHRQINTNLPHSGSYQRMYALGVDAFKLHLRLGQLGENGSGRLFGETGTLQLNPLRQIERQLSLAEIRNGAPVAIPLSEDVGLKP